MFLFHKVSRTRRLLPPLVLVGVLIAPTTPMAGEPVAVSRPLPDVQVRALDTSQDVRLPSALAGRPAVVLVAEAGRTGECAVGTAAGDLQREYGPWFSWVALLSGPFTVADIDRLRDSAPMRIERLYLDRTGAVRTTLGIARLPAMLLVDEDGAVHEVCTPDEGTDQFAHAARTIQSIAAASRRRRAGIADFRLPQVGGGGLVSFLDVAGSQSTMLSFIHSNCLPCARQLEVLDFARIRHAGEVSFVTVFLDDAQDSRIRGFVAAAGVTPDFLLRDPDLRLAANYGVDTVPALLLIDADGRIVLSRSGYREEDREGLYRDLEANLATGALVAGAGGPAVGEARRIHAEAVEFLREGRPEFALMYQERIREMLPEYPSVHLRIAEAAIAAGNRDLAIRSLARYLAAQPQTYDSTAVREAIASLLASSP